MIVHNAEYEAGKHSFYLGLNHLADMELGEYRKTMLGFRASSSSSSLLAAKTHQSNSTPPASWDWRNTQNVVGPVKNQGQCGSCWAFSAVATMEGALNLATKKIHSLSEQELVDCVNGGQDTCSQGGQMYDGVEYGVTHGMEAEADYSYQGTSGHKCAFSASKSVHKFSGYVNITSGDEKALTNAAWEKPIISVGIDASSFRLALLWGVFDLKSQERHQIWT